ncbi:UNKNOWN [Stylonychia lemnae]|uniref:Uncharacterized protein n=1 Tax=Stylonychia lemnae TaxID=5949 RepID=A0A078B6V7_STYLE|nr:UNKNOWN [Stylonychia lemnae]|eukprot:CDW89027.1 UNKNOWN [Stylonychia lemnae]
MTWNVINTQEYTDDQIASGYLLTAGSNNDNSQKIRKLNLTSFSQLKNKTIALSQNMNRDLLIDLCSEDEIGSIESHTKKFYGLFDQTILLVSRAIGIGFMYFPSFSNWQIFITAYYNGGGRASVIGVSVIIIFTFSLYPSQYFKLIGSVVVELICRISNQNLHLDQPYNESLNCKKPNWRVLSLNDNLLSLFPNICFAFSFEGFVMPMHQLSVIKDHNGGRAFKACLYYIMTILMTGNKNDNLANLLSIILLIMVLTQSILQLLYTFYENNPRYSKERLLANKKRNCYNQPFQALYLLSKIGIV